MKRIYYASGSFLTSDAIADALIIYADALAHTNGSDIVDFPIVLPDGTTGTASALMGPASQLATATELSDLPEPVSEQLLTDLKQLTRVIGMPRPVVQPREEADIKADLDLDAL
ncbi:MAG: hypothetical protein ACOH1T_03940 [Microbacteriaceae bacterium]